MLMNKHTYTIWFDYWPTFYKLAKEVNKMVIFWKCIICGEICVDFYISLKNDLPVNWYSGVFGVADHKSEVRIRKF